MLDHQKRLVPYLIAGSVILAVSVASLVAFSGTRSIIGTTWVASDGVEYHFKTPTVVEKRDSGHSMSFEYVVEGNVVTIKNFFFQTSMEWKGDTLTGQTMTGEAFTLNRKQ